ncbi:MAG: hypothetical protein ACT6S0_15370 [Roseateles sp.]|uniref:hypothetical protein n=1 Tax=Roseateles sp. TaxID=1971397 RepID=UPI00403718DF
MGSAISFIAFAGYIVLVLLLVMLAVRFVRAHERGAAALEEIARRFNDRSPGASG